MPSPGSGRRVLERVARAAALAALGALLWRHRGEGAARPAARGVATTASLDARLREATRAPMEALALTADTVPDRARRDWLAAVAGAGTAVHWSVAPGVHPLTMSAEAVADPSGRLRLTAVGHGGSAIALRDDGGTVDSAVIGAGGVREVEGGLEGGLSVSAPGIVARGRVTDSLMIRPILVLARAGWEGKFTVAALEESGWRVDARFQVAPGANVEQGALLGVDTSRYAAVVALDGSAAPWGAAIARYVREGGGAVVSGDALRLPALASILPAVAGDSLAATLGALTSATPRLGLAATTLRATSPTAVVLERRGARPVAVAGRVSLGRVVALGYAESWRWRMMGSEGADAAHRRWWTALVSSVARAPRAVSAVSADSRNQDESTLSDRLPDAAPYAGIVALLGSPTVAAGAPAAPLARIPWNAILFALTLAGLLIEWVSRRTRGAR